MKPPFELIEQAAHRPMVAAVLGSLIATSITYRQSKKLGEPVDWLMLFAGAICGIAASTYLAPWFASLIGADKFVGGVSFLVGLLAMNVMQTIWEGIRSGEFRAVLLSWITRR